MFAVGNILWIILILHIYSILPVGCKATTVTKEIWMEDDEESDAMYVSKLGRRLLDSGDRNYRSTSYKSSSDAVIYVVIFALIALAALIIKCCIHLASTQEEEEPLRTEHPPPNRPPVQRSERLPRCSRPLAPPRTSRSIILFPEERQFDPLFIGLQNPAFDSSTSSNPTFATSTSRNAAFDSSISRNPAIDSSISRNPDFGSSTSRNAAFDSSISRNPAIDSSIFRNPDFVSSRSSNPAFDFSTLCNPDFYFSTSTRQVESNSNFSSVLDPPPDYESAVKGDAEKCTESNSKDAEDDPPPKYDFT